MSVIEGLIRKEEDNTLSFGDYTLNQKSKVSDFEFQGDIYKVKTFKEITKLEKNEIFVYESVPGTVVNHFKDTAEVVEFEVEGVEDAQITLELEPEQEYEVYVDAKLVDTMKTNLGGKLSVGVALEADKTVAVKVVRVK